MADEAESVTLRFDFAGDGEADIDGADSSASAASTVAVRLEARLSAPAFGSARAIVSVLECDPCKPLSLFCVRAGPASVEERRRAIESGPNSRDSMRLEIGRVGLGGWTSDGEFSSYTFSPCGHDVTSLRSSQACAQRRVALSRVVLRNFDICGASKARD